MITIKLHCIVCLPLFGPAILLTKTGNSMYMMYIANKLLQLLHCKEAHFAWKLPKESCSKSLAPSHSMIKLTCNESADERESLQCRFQVVMPPSTQDYMQVDTHNLSKRGLVPLFYPMGRCQRVPVSQKWGEVVQQWVLLPAPSMCINKARLRPWCQTKLCNISILLKESPAGPHSFNSLYIFWLT